MGQRKVIFAPGEYYHVYNRGTDKRDIFLDSLDYKRFTQLLFLCNSSGSLNMRNVYRDYNSVYDYDREDQLVAIGAYCLMPNHFHILISQIADDGLAKFMSKLGTSYSMYFNKKYERSGALFQGRFKAKMVVEDVYMKYLYAYIHLNPVKLINPQWKEAGIKDTVATMNYLHRYEFSSFPCYIDVNRDENLILEKSKFPHYFENAVGNVNELNDWLQYKE